MDGRSGPGTTYQSSSPASAHNPFHNCIPNPNRRHQPHPDPDEPVRRNILPNILAIVGCSAFALALVFFFLKGLDKLLDYMEERPEFLVDSFSLSNFTFSNRSRVFIVSEAQLSARNPNSKFSLSYDQIAVSIYYKHELLFQNGLPPFSQEANNETSLVATLAGDGNVVDEWVVDGINGEIGKKGSVGLNLLLISSIAWTNSSHDTMMVVCRDLVVGIPRNGSPGRLTRVPKPCQVGRDSDARNYLSTRD